MKRKGTNHYNGVKAGIWYTLGNILIKAVPFITLPIFTRLLTPDEFGIYNTFIAYEGILSVLLGFGISGSVKIAKLDFDAEFDRYVSSVYSLVLTAGIGIFAVGNLCFGLFRGSSWLDRITLNILILYSVSVAIYTIASCKYVIEGRYIQNLLMVFGMTVLNIGSSLILCYVGLSSQRALARMTGTALGAAVIAVLLLILQSRRAKIIPYKKANRYALKLGIPLIPHQLSVSLLAQCDKIMINSMVGNFAAGIYGLAVNFTTVLSVLMTSIDNAWTPWFYNALKENRYRELNRVNNMLVVLFMYLSCGFLLVGTDVIKLLSTEVYWDSVYAFVPLTVSVYLNFMYLFSVGVEYFMKKTGYISATTITCTLANIILNILFIRIGGYLAAAYATCLSKLLLFLLHYVRARKLLSQPVVSLKYLVLSLGAVCLIGGIVSAAEQILWIRYTLVVLLSAAVLGYFKRAGMFDSLIKKLNRK